MRRLAITLTFLAAFAAPALHAQTTGNYPTRPVTMIVPQAPGGANDTVARILAQKLTENLGQQFVVENRPGAGGNIGTALAAKAPKDGHTLLVTVNSAHVINPALYRNPGFDPVKDFIAVTPFATVAYLLVAHPDFPANTTRELVDLARAKKDLAYASAGNGTLNHLLGEMLKTQTGIELLHIPYKGAAASATDVLAGRVPLSFQSMPSVVSHIQAGKLKVIGVANEKRVKALPDVPAMGETIAGYGASPWYGIFVPAGTPMEVVKRIHEATVRALAAKDLQDRMHAQGAEVTSSSPEQFAAQVRDELPLWAKVVKASGAQVD